MPGALTRRDLARGAVAALALHPFLDALLAGQALGAADRVVSRWVRELVQRCSDVQRATLTPLDWQEAIAALYRRIPLEDVIRAIDLDALAAGLTLPRDLGTVREVRLPAVVGVDPRSLRFG